ncbi:MAG: hypothetical protein GX675_04850 [Erysipelotrichaceae bacterium]|nr:hypothetical protein [Erysipelotrichaceae bacterium]
MVDTELVNKCVKLIHEFDMTSESQLMEHINPRETTSVLERLDYLGLITITDDYADGLHFIVNKD